MSRDQVTRNGRTPLHLWVVGVLSFLWNAMGAFDYLMTQTRNEAYMGKFSPEQIEYYYGFPSWVVAFWAIAVWGAVAGSILLLLRKRLAVWVFLVSFLAMVVTTVHNYGLSNGLEMAGGTGALAFSAVIFVVALFLFLYARALKNRELLR